MKETIIIYFIVKLQPSLRVNSVLYTGGQNLGCCRLDSLWRLGLNHLEKLWVFLSSFCKYQAYFLSPVCKFVNAKYFHGRCPLGRGRHNVKILCVCICQTLLSKANTNDQDDQGSFQDGQEGKDRYQGVRNVIRMVPIPRMVSIHKKELSSYLECCRWNQGGHIKFAWKMPLSVFFA